MTIGKQLTSVLLSAIMTIAGMAPAAVAKAVVLEPIQEKVAMQADLDFKLVKHSGTGCSEPGSVFEPPNPVTKTVLQLLYKNLSVTAEGKSSDGAPIKSSLACRVTIAITYNYGYEVSVRYMEVRGDRFFTPGSRGALETSFQDHAKAMPEPEYTTSMPLFSQDKQFALEVRSVDRVFRGCGSEVQVTLDVMLTLRAAPSGDGAIAALTSSRTGVNQPSEIGVELRQCVP